MATLSSCALLPVGNITLETATLEDRTYKTFPLDKRLLPAFTRYLAVTRWHPNVEREGCVRRPPPPYLLECKGRQQFTGAEIWAYMSLDDDFVPFDVRLTDSR